MSYSFSGDAVSSSLSLQVWGSENVSGAGTLVVLLGGIVRVVLVVSVRCRNSGGFP